MTQEFSKSATSVPIPDPTLLTTQQLIREINSLREVIETRLDGMDKAIQLLQATADKFPGRMDEKIASLKSVHDERFTSIEKQFVERDVRTEQTAKDSKVAVDAALQAAKEAVGEQNKSSALAIAKSDAMTTKQIDQLGAIGQQNANALDGKIADIKERLTRIEGRGEGQQVAIVSQASASSNWIAAGALLLAIVVGAADILFNLLRK